MFGDKNKFLVLSIHCAVKNKMFSFSTHVQDLIIITDFAYYVIICPIPFQHRFCSVSFTLHCCCTHFFFPIQQAFTCQVNNYIHV